VDECVMHYKQLQTAQTPSSKPVALRTTATAIAHFEQSTTGTKDTRTDRSCSQIRLPLVTGEIAGCIGPAPLHVKLGLTKDVLTELYAETAKLDQQPLKQRRWFADRRMQTVQVRHFRDLCLREQSLQRDQTRMNEQLAKARRKLEHLIRQCMVLEIKDTTDAIDQLKEELKSTGNELLAVTDELDSTD
jgi:hypothetical protein